MTKDEIASEAARVMPAPVLDCKWVRHTLCLTLDMGRPVVIEVRNASGPDVAEVVREIGVAVMVAEKTLFHIEAAR